jgi:hypothetical protein
MAGVTNNRSVVVHREFVDVASIFQRSGEAWKWEKKKVRTRDVRFQPQLNTMPNTRLNHENA